MLSLLRRLYYRGLLFIFPSVEDLLNRIQTVVQQIDRLTDAMERVVEEHVVALAASARSRREAVQAINARFDAEDSARVAYISSTRSKLDQAIDARSRVTAVLAG